MSQLLQELQCEQVCALIYNVRGPTPSRTTKKTNVTTLTESYIQSPSRRLSELADLLTNLATSKIELLILPCQMRERRSTKNHNIRHGAI